MNRYNKLRRLPELSTYVLNLKNGNKKKFNANRSNSVCMMVKINHKSKAHKGEQIKWIINNKSSEENPKIFSFVHLWHVTSNFSWHFYLCFFSSYLFNHIHHTMCSIRAKFESLKNAPQSPSREKIEVHRFVVRYSNILKVFINYLFVYIVLYASDRASKDDCRFNTQFKLKLSNRMVEGNALLPFEIILSTVCFGCSVRC